MAASAERLQALARQWHGCRPAAVFSMGGYVAGPVVLAAVSAGFRLWRWSRMRFPA